MGFNISYKILIKCNVKVLKHLLPSCCQGNVCPAKIRFKINEIKCNASIPFSLRFTVYISHELGNLQILKLPWRADFSYLRETQPLRVILESDRS